MDIRKIYEYALQREHEGKRFFAENADRLSHAAAAGAFRQLAAEEQTHINFIQAQLDALDMGEQPRISMGIELEQDGFFLSTGRVRDARSDRGGGHGARSACAPHGLLDRA